MCKPCQAKAKALAAANQQKTVSTQVVSPISSFQKPSSKLRVVSSGLKKK